MDRLVPVLSDRVRPLLDRPYAFYGHSLGGKLAFETARNLRRSGGQPPVHLFVAACPAPQIPWLHPLMHILQEREFLEEVSRRYGGVPQQVVEDPELRALFLPQLRADVTLLETYRYLAEEPLDCGITAFGGVDDRLATHSQLDPWRLQTRRSFRKQMLQAGHFFTPAAQTEVIRAISAELAQLQDLSPVPLRAHHL